MAYNINDYEPVENRLAEFWKDYPNGRIATQLVYQDETRFIVRSEVYRDATDAYPAATGYAEERVDPNPKRVNFASALENCETSSLGRSLANFVYATKGKRPSREEMEKVQRMTRVDNGVAITPGPASMLKAALAAWHTDAKVRKGFVEQTLGRQVGSLDELTPEEIETVKAALEQRITQEAPFTE